MRFTAGQLLGLGFATFAVGASLALMFLAQQRDAAPTPAMETSEVKPWQTLDDGQRWDVLVDAEPGQSIVTITRTGERIDLIEVFPPPGVPVRVYDNDGELVEYERCATVALDCAAVMQPVTQ